MEEPARWEGGGRAFLEREQQPQTHHLFRPEAVCPDLPWERKERERETLVGETSIGCLPFAPRQGIKPAT